MSDNMKDREYQAQTVSIKKKVAGYVDVDGSSFSIRMTDQQARDFAFSIICKATLNGPEQENKA